MTRFMLKDTYEYEQEDARIVVRLAFDERAKRALGADPPPQGLSPAELVAFLQEHGAVFNDGVDGDGKIIPAVRQYDPWTGQLFYIAHYRDDMRHDPAPGVSALLRFNKKNGALVEKTHYQNGLMQDPGPGLAARTLYNAHTGRLICLGHCTEGVLHDPAPGIAAEQMFDSETSHRVRLVHYNMGVVRAPAPGVPPVQDFSGRTGIITAARHVDEKGRPAAFLSPPELRDLALKSGMWLPSIAPAMKPPSLTM